MLTPWRSPPLAARSSSTTSRRSRPRRPRSRASRAEQQLPGRRRRQLRGSRPARSTCGGRVRPPRRHVHERRGAARQGALEDVRRGVRPRHRDTPAGRLHLRQGGGAVPARARGRGTADPGRLARRAARQLRSDELLGGQGRNRSARPNVGHGVRARPDHGQCPHSDRLHADGRHHSCAAAARREGRRRRADSELGSPAARARYARGRRGPRGLSRLGRRGRNHGAVHRHRGRPARALVASGRGCRGLPGRRLVGRCHRRHLVDDARSGRADLRDAAAGAGQAD